MTRIVRADERYRSEQDGIESFHCFAAGGHYDPDNISFGALLGCDEHVLAPGAGFDWHAHRGVDIVSWVLAGSLRHEDDAGRVQVVDTGRALLQATGTGIRHAERNASDDAPLRLVQMTLSGGAHPPSVRLAAPPVESGEARFLVWHGAGSAESAQWHVFVAAGTWRLDQAVLGAGDSARGADRLVVSGTGELLVWLL